ncbi:BgiBFREP12.7, partial [Biomphalaria glabrata]
SEMESLRLLLCALLLSVTNSELTIDIQPHAISLELTPKLVINCSITNNQAQHLQVIKSLTLSRYQESLKEFEVLLSLEAKTLNLTQLVQLQHSQINVGDFYLALTLHNPSKFDARVYRCKAEGDTPQGTNSSSVVKKEVHYTTNSTALVEEIRRLKEDEKKDKCFPKKEDITGYYQRSRLHFVASSRIVTELLDPLTLKCFFQVSKLDSVHNFTVQFLYILHETKGVVATMSKNQPVLTTINENNVKNAKGELFDNELKDSYIEVTWSHLKSSESGKYFCGAHVTDSKGTSERLNEMLTITVTGPTFEDLVKVLQKLLAQKDEDKENEKNIIKRIDDLETKQRNIISIKDDIDSYIQNMNKIKDELNSQKQNISSIRDDLNTNTQHMNSITDDLNVNGQNLKNIKDEININRQNISSIKADLNTNAQKIDLITGDFNSNRLQLLSINKDLNASQQSMTEFKLDLETQLANLSTELNDMKKNINKEGNDVVLKRRFGFSKPISCRDISSTQNHVIVTLVSGLQVMCDTKTDGGGWIIFQRRINGKVDFYRGWKEYRDGFGDYDIGEFYLGNENIFKLTSRRQFDLRIDLEFNNTKYFAQYENFKVLSETEKYKLKIGKYSGNAGDDLLGHNNKYFTTFDRDNDVDSGRNCAESSSGAWWYSSCHQSNLNGKWGSTSYDRGLNWGDVTGWAKSVSFSEMKIREPE